MSRSAFALRFFLALLTLAMARSSVEAAPDIAWDVRFLSAPWAGVQPERVELLMDAGSDALDRKLSIQQGTYLSHVTGLSLGKTEEVGGATVVFPLGEAFTVESAGSGPSFSLDFDPLPNAARRGSWTVDLKLTMLRQLVHERTLPLHPHRARLWVLPRASGVFAVLMEAWPAIQTPQVAPPQDTVQVELAIVRGDWRRGQAPGHLVEADFPTWLDPFELEPGAPAIALMRPVSAGAADAGTLMFRHSMKVPLGEIGAYERGRRPGEAARPSRDFLSATVSMREVEPGATSFLATVALQSPYFGASDLAMLRRFVLEDGATHCWIVPTEEHLHAVFVRVHRGHRGLSRPVHPGS